ncbi:hypothetical protein HYPSUDRAFT_67735 [Hypholoma sublateritium FD-334 SS-4]|uniref:Uncharacterized protein n=1 Tax=Hypholoma sublateritium (strain FD-334 SS-4) TaxID=945553 RepID=A0A0D2NRI3_HYPSF|nr:hypothetical protein HYPSUDRAFT_67735 [Hypholoma sublateritium FD-334 SS-4]
MAMATNNLRQTNNSPTWSSSSSLTPVQRPQQQVQPQPMTAPEQYWATRALRAEALLEAHLTHKKEVQTVGEAHDVRREREIGALAKEYKEKHASLEGLLHFLFVLISILVLVIIYLTTHFTRHSLLMQDKQQERWWSAIGASHFTIPVLSPFTSVIEQETSAIGVRVIGTLAAITACLAYFAFRHWLAKQPKSPATASTSSVTNTAMATISRAII